MKKFIDHWNNYTVYAFNFKNPLDLCEYVRKAEINTKIFPMHIVKDQGSEGSDETVNGGGWYQTENIKQAIDFCTDGWHKGFDFFKSLKRTLDFKGDKLTILSRSKNKPINILVNLSYRWETTHEAVVNRGVIIQNLVNELERNGYMVNLKTFSLNYYEDEVSCVVVKLKEVEEHLDIRKAYFAFCNPSFLRRLVFRVMESSDFKKDGWNQNYGYLCEYDFIKKAFSTGKFDIVIPQPSEIGITGQNIIEDWRQFLIFENLHDFFDF